MDYKYLKIIWDQPDILANYDGNDIKPEWMTKYPKTYNWIYEGYKEGKKLTEEQIISLMKRDGANDEVIFDTISYDGQDFDARMIIDELKTECTQLVIEKAYDLASSGKLNSAEDLVALYNKYVPSLEKKEEDEIVLDSIDNIYSTLDDVFTDEAHIPSGWDNIDKLSGGWYVGDTHCIVAGSGIGKSIILANIARRALETGRSVLYITTEMNKKQQLQRIYKSYFDAKNEDDIKVKLHMYKGQAFPLSVIKVHPNSVTTLDIKKMAEGKKFDILVIDYMDELKATEKTKDEYEKHRILGTDLKRLAEELNVPLITASQTNRSTIEGGATKSYVGLESIGDSWNKVKALSFVYTVVQTAAMKQEDGLSGYVLSLQKSRYTGKGDVAFSINYKTMRMQPLQGKSEIDVAMYNNPTQKVINEDKFLTRLQGELLRYFNNLKNLDDLTFIKELKTLKSEKKITSKELTLISSEIARFRNQILEDDND